MSEIKVGDRVVTEFGPGAIVRPESPPLQVELDDGRLIHLGLGCITIRVVGEAAQEIDLRHMGDMGQR